MCRSGRHIALGAKVSKHLFRSLLDLIRDGPCSVVSGFRLLIGLADEKFAMHTDTGI